MQDWSLQLSFWKCSRTPLGLGCFLGVHRFSLLNMFLTPPKESFHDLPGPGLEGLKLPGPRACKGSLKPYEMCLNAFKAHASILVQVSISSH